MQSLSDRRHAPTQNFSFSNLEKVRDNKAQTRLMLLQRSNDGLRFMEQHYPHLIAELENQTVGWLLAGKYILTNKATLQDYIDNSRELMSVMAVPPIIIPEGFTVGSIIARWEILLTTLENQIMSLLPDPPAFIENASFVTSDEMSEMKEIGEDENL